MPDLIDDNVTTDLGMASLIDKYERERSVQDEVSYSPEALTQKLDTLYPTPADKGLAPPELEGQEITDLIPFDEPGQVSQSSPTQEDPPEEGDGLLMGSLKFLEWAAGPLISFGDAAIAPIGHDYDPENTALETAGEAFKVSGQAWLRRFFPHMFPEAEMQDEDGQVPFYGRQVVDKYMTGLPESAKAPVGIALEIMSDPSIMLGLPALKVFQAGTQAQRTARTAGMGVWQLGLMDLMGTANVSQVGPQGVPSAVRAANQVQRESRRGFFRDLTGKKEVAPTPSSSKELVVTDSDIVKSGEIVEDTAEVIEKTTKGNVIKDFFGPQNRRTFMKRSAQAGAAAAVLAHPFKLAIDSITPTTVKSGVKAAVGSLRTVDPLIASKKWWAELIHLDGVLYESFGGAEPISRMLKNMDVLSRKPSVELMADEQVFTNLHKFMVDEEVTKLSFEDWAAEAITSAKQVRGEDVSLSGVLEKTRNRNWEHMYDRLYEAWEIYDADVIDTAVRFEFQVGEELDQITKRYGLTDQTEIAEFKQTFRGYDEGDSIVDVSPRIEKITKQSMEMIRDTKKHTWMNMVNDNIPQSWRSTIYRLALDDIYPTILSDSMLRTRGVQGNPAVFRNIVAERLSRLKMGEEAFEAGKLTGDIKHADETFDLPRATRTYGTEGIYFPSPGKLSPEQVAKEIKVFEEILGMPDEKFVDLFVDTMMHEVRFEGRSLDGMVRTASRELMNGQTNPTKVYPEFQKELLRLAKKGKFGPDPNKLKNYVDHDALEKVDTVAANLSGRVAYTDEMSKFADGKPNQISDFLADPKSFYKDKTLTEFAEDYYTQLLKAEAFEIERRSRIPTKHPNLIQQKTPLKETQKLREAAVNLREHLESFQDGNLPADGPAKSFDPFKQRGAIQNPFSSKPPEEVSQNVRQLRELAKRADAGDLDALKQLDAELDNVDGVSLAATKDNRDIVRKMKEVNNTLGARDEVYQGTTRIPSTPQVARIFRSSTTVAERLGDNPEAIRAVHKASIVNNAVNIELQPNYINLEKIEDVDTLMSTYVDIYADQAEYLFKGREGALEEQSTLLVDLLGDQKLDIKPNTEGQLSILGRAVSSEVLYGYRQALLDSTERIRKLATDTQPEGLMAQLSKATGDIREYALAKEIYMHKIMRERLLGIQPKSSADALHILNIAHETPVGQFQELRRVFPMIEESARIQRLFKAIAKESDPKTISAMAADMFKANFADVAHELFVNNILSALKTHAINVASNFSQMAVPPAQKTLQAMSSAARGRLSGAGDEFVEAAIMTQTAVESMGDFVKLLFTRNGFQSVDMPAELTRLHEIARIRHHPAVSSEALNYNGLWAPALDWLGKMIRIPGASLLREDVAAKVIQYRMSVNSNAIRQARKRGQNAADVKELYEIFRNHPTEKMTTEGINQANILTFTNELGSKGRILQNIKRTIPGARYVIPFIQTPTNIVKFGVRHSVFGNVFRDLKPALSRLDSAGDAARAKIVMGSVIPGYIISSLGEDITGQIDLHDPLGQLTTQTGAKPPYSMKIAGEWYSYQGIEPLRTVLGLMVSYRDSIQALDWSGDDFMGYFEGNQSLQEFAGSSADMLSHLAVTAAAPFIRVIGDNYLLPQVGSLFYAIDAIRASNDPTIPAEDREHWKSYVMRYLQRFASLTATVPGANFSKSMVQSGGFPSETFGFYDPGFKNAENYFDMVKSQLPYFSKSVPNHRNLYGDVQALPGGFGPDIISPIYTRPEARDEVDIRLAQIKPVIPRPKKKLAGVRMTPQEQEEYAIMVGKGFAGLGEIKEELRATINLPYFNSISVEGQRALIENLIHSRRNAAEGYYIGNNIEFRKKVIARQRREAEKMRPIR